MPNIPLPILLTSTAAAVGWIGWAREHGKRKHAEAEAALAKRRFVEMVERGGDVGERTVGE